MGGATGRFTRLHEAVNDLTLFQLVHRGTSWDLDVAEERDVVLRIELGQLDLLLLRVSNHALAFVLSQGDMIVDDHVLLEGQPDVRANLAEVLDAGLHERYVWILEHDVTGGLDSQIIAVDGQPEE